MLNILEDYIEAISTHNLKDCVAQLPDLSFYTGSIATMDQVLRVAHKEYGLPLVDTVKMITLTPAKISKCDSHIDGIEIGKDADIVIMNDEFYVKKVFTKDNLFFEGK